jgi:hypothetical protein
VLEMVKQIQYLVEESNWKEIEFLNMISFIIYLHHWMGTFF